MAQQAQISQYATDRARLLLGCYRTGDANDPETYVAAIAATLARYSEKVITSVTHPVTGLPKAKSWLPTVKEVFDACEEANEFDVQQAAREKRIKEQLEARAAEDAKPKPTLEELQAKYGKDYGLSVPETPISKWGPDQPLQAPTWAKIAAMYQAEPGRITHLADAMKRLRGDDAQT
jgi:hypothetical protein